jgi:glyceraldehyde 3-phosphate dehydrogenase
MAKKLRVGINGFGRIGRVATRQLFQRSEFELVAVNDLSSIDMNAHLLKYDSVHGVWDKLVAPEKEAIKIGDSTVQVFAKKDPAEIPWAKLGVDLVFECTGVFTGSA